MHIQVTNMAFPHAFVIPMSAEMTITQWHAPVDDTHCYWYAIFTSFTQPVDKAAMRAQRLKLYTLPDTLPDDVPRTNKLNDCGFDPAKQAHATYTGMGDDINVHDQWAVESMGPIQDRTKENLASSDKAIAAFRRLLVRAIRDVGEGRRPLLALDAAAAARVQGPPSIDAIGPVEGWEAHWRAQDWLRRERAPWTASLSAAA